MANIASEAGFFWETLWNLPENADLKSLRKDPYVLLPGDSVIIPDIRVRTESRNTDAKHTFVRKGVPEKLHIVILDDREQPVAGAKYVLEIDGKRTEGQTDAEGAIHHSIPPNARKGHLVVGEGKHLREYNLNLGHLDPIDTLSGLQARLFNLGYYDGPRDGQMNGQLRTALMMFQQKQQLEVTGEPNDPTRAKIKERFGC